MRQYPIWVDMINNSYNSSKSYGVNDYNIQNVKIGTSSRNSFDFVKLEIGVANEYLKKTYSLYVDGELIKQAVYNTKTKKMELEDVKTSNFVLSEKALKIKYFKKWKAEADAKDQAYRNERFAERLRVNGGY
tara:strand:+ start:1847 stop:2242 length:396 start_codon:yes stop_codon:yes gene_type:complete